MTNATCVGYRDCRTRSADPSKHARHRCSRRLAHCLSQPNESILHHLRVYLQLPSALMTRPADVEATFLTTLVDGRPCPRQPDL